MSSSRSCSSLYLRCWTDSFYCKDCFSFSCLNSPAWLFFYCISFFICISRISFSSCSLDSFSRLISVIMFILYSYSFLYSSSFSCFSDFFLCIWFRSKSDFNFYDVSSTYSSISFIVRSFSSALFPAHSLSNAFSFYLCHLFHSWYLSSSSTCCLLSSFLNSISSLST